MVQVCNNYFKMSDFNAAETAIKIFKYETRTSDYSFE
jgi:hypothetical protein